MKTILIFFGGCSTEHAVSLQSAHAVLTHMDPARFRPLMVGITREGRWLRYCGPVQAIADGSWEADRAACTPCTLCPDRGRHELLVLGEPMTRLPFDAALPILHGKNGEDGSLQGLLELAGVPVAGCGALSSALCMDKDRAHKLAALAGVAVPKGVVLGRHDTDQAVQAAQALGYPLFVKPVRAGSSFGISRVTIPEHLAVAVEEALGHDREVLLEQAIPGFEVGCAVLGNETLTVGVVDAIQLSGGFFDYEEKYTLKTSAILCPAPISMEKTAEIQQCARTVYRALDCRGFARVDFFLTPSGQVVFNEVNTIPGFTTHSRYPNMMKAVGLSFEEVVSSVIELAVAE